MGFLGADEQKALTPTDKLGWIGGARGGDEVFAGSGAGCETSLRGLAWTLGVTNLPILVTGRGVIGAATGAGPLSAGDTLGDLEDFLLTLAVWVNLITSPLAGSSTWWAASTLAARPISMALSLAGRHSVVGDEFETTGSVGAISKNGGGARDSGGGTGNKPGNTGGSGRMAGCTS